MGVKAKVSGTASGKARPATAAGKSTRGITPAVFQALNKRIDEAEQRADRVLAELNLLIRK